MRWTLFSLLAFCCSVVMAENPAKPKEMSPASRLKLMEAEIESLGGHAWAGAYSDGVDGGFSGPLQVWIAPTSGAASKQRDCMSEETEFGSIAVNDSVVQIDWDSPSRTGRLPTERELLVVPYQQYVYLVPKNGIHPFCVALRTKGRLPVGVLRSIKKKEAPGFEKPQLPEEFEKYFDLPSIQANVVAVGKQNRVALEGDLQQVTQTVELDVGTDDHAFVGMRFEDTKGTPPFHNVTIVDVKKSQSTARSSYFVETGEKIRRIRKSWTFKTESR